MRASFVSEKALLTFAALCTVSPVQACLNDTDSDSLAQEGRALPDVVRVLTGRFERNPPRFYEMRMERVAREIAAHPDRLPLYDDLAVACDRLGRDTQAIAWIEKKRGKMAGTNWKTANAEVREAWYRYYANIGTFRVHRWVRAGADRRRLGEVVHARDEIARALQIKPNAHFNREPYQLAAMNWILHPYVNDADGTMSQASFADYLRETRTGATTEAKAETEGLSGLIVLGNAWESVDITDALARSLYDSKQMNVAYLAYLRFQELRLMGRRSLVRVSQNGDESLEDRITDQLYNPEEIKGKYRVLRQEAETWRKERTRFMLARLREGRHPDTDWDFWMGYHPTAAPPLDNPSDAINAQKVAKEQGRRAEVQRIERLFAICGWVLLMILPPLFMLGVLSFARRMKKVHDRRDNTVQRRTSRPE